MPHKINVPVEFYKTTKPGHHTSKYDAPVIILPIGYQQLFISA